MWLNLCQDGHYQDAAGLGGQVAEFSAEVEKHGDGPADSFSANMLLGDWIWLSWLHFCGTPVNRSRRYHFPLKSIRINFHLNSIKLGLADRNTPLGELEFPLPAGLIVGSENTKTYMWFISP